MGKFVQDGKSDASRDISLDISRDKTTKSAALLLVGTALDTTWRTLAPGIIGLLIGLWIDRTWHTVPLMMVVGLLLGMALSAVLIYQQLKAVKR